MIRWMRGLIFLMDFGLREAAWFTLMWWVMLASWMNWMGVSWATSWATIPQIWQTSQKLLATNSIFVEYFITCMHYMLSNKTWITSSSLIAALTTSLGHEKVVKMWVKGIKTITQWPKGKLFYNYILFFFLFFFIIVETLKLGVIETKSRV